MEKPLRYVRNVWLEGKGALCLGIPLEIVKKIGLTRDSFLYVELVDDLIVMKKHDPKLTKTEKTKSKRINEITTESHSQNVQKTPVENEYNPLDDIF